ncbi:holiday junction resolvase-like protein [Cryptosporidium canis]|uniref:Structure-specific endonuclease subunit SLX1 homolog n=1 Tax=Cryptosporidium canis TaxID=195482 RepID=A0A9D5DDQ1_9CRYT|nr:holiday junction resolvase-like protein [Cryptosporidium canis]
MKYNLHYCYFLLSEAKKKASYIGYSVNPCRRLRQHNGEIKKGAKKTKDGIPWSLGICVGGFPDRVAALRFEWAWQHPNICKATRDGIESWRIVKAKRTSENRRILNKRQWSIQQRVSILLCMTTLEPWRSMNLTIFVFKDEIESIIKEVVETSKKLKIQADFTCPNVLNKDCLLMFLYLGTDDLHEKGTKFLKCDYDTFREIQRPSLDCESDSNIEDNSGVFNPEPSSSSSEESGPITCSLCQKSIENGRSYMEFPCCAGMSVHVSCIQPWGESGGPSETSEGWPCSLNDLVAPLVPRSISCPCCFRPFDWECVKSCHIKSGGVSIKSLNSAEGTPEQPEVVVEEISRARTSERGHLRTEECEYRHSGTGRTLKKDPLFSDDEFSELSQKCEIIDLTVESD